MSKSTQNLIIGIGIASILFTVYGIIKGGDFISALSGIAIGAALIGTVLIERNKNKKQE